MVTWKRVMDMNDRALRKIVNSLEGAANSLPREDGYDIAVASEVVAILHLATSIPDLKKRLRDIIIGYGHGSRDPVYAKDLNAQGVCYGGPVKGCD